MERALKKHYFLFLCLFVTMCSTNVLAQMRSPAEFTSVPVDSAVSTQLSNSLTSLPFLGVIKLYQQFISPVRGTACPMFPSCSQYGYQAISTYGLTGTIKTAYRLLRCGQDVHYYQIVKIGPSYRYFDALNDEKKQ